LIGLPRELRHNMGTVYCENRNGATQQTLFQDRVLWSPLRQIRAVVRAGLTIAWPFPWAIRRWEPFCWEHSLHYCNSFCTYRTVWTAGLDEARTPSCCIGPVNCRFCVCRIGPQSQRPIETSMPLISQPSKTWIKKEEGLPRGKNGQPRFQKLPAAETGVGVNNPLTAPT
jgi:hypothetical protein